MGVAVERAGWDGGLVKLKGLLGAVTRKGGLQRPTFQVARDPYFIVPPSDGLDRHIEDAIREAALWAEHGSGIFWVGAREILHQVCGAVVIRVGIGIDPEMAEVEEFPAIGQAVAIDVRDGGGCDRIEHFDQAGVAEGRAALGGQGGKGSTDGRVVEYRPTGGFAAAGINLGRDGGLRGEKRAEDEWRWGEGT